ncbi:hypothetical protein IWZ01DRAFT_494876 [Phyllosticta capitalensis]
MLLVLLLLLRPRVLLQVLKRRMCSRRTIIITSPVRRRLRRSISITSIRIPNTRISTSQTVVFSLPLQKLGRGRVEADVESHLISSSQGSQTALIMSCVPQKKHTWDYFFSLSVWLPWVGSSVSGAFIRREPLVSVCLSTNEWNEREHGVPGEKKNQAIASLLLPL